MPVVRSEHTVAEETGDGYILRKDSITPIPTSISVTQGASTPIQGKDSRETCLLCLELPTDPKTLLCGHAFCAQCLIEYMDNYPGVDLKAGNHICVTNDQIKQMRCPTCLQTTRTDSDLPPGGAVENRVRCESVSSKTSNPSPASQLCDVCSFRSRLVDTEVHCGKCALSLCSECKEVHGNHVLFKSHAVVHIANKVSMSIYCTEHKLQSLYFCDGCQRACCAICILQEHSEHISCTLFDALSYRKDKLKSQLNTMGPQLDKIELRLKTLNQMANRKMCTSSQTFLRSVSEPTTDHNQSMEIQSDPHSKNELGGLEETSQLLPRIQFNDEQTPVATPEKKRKSVDHSRKTSRKLSLTSAEWRKLSFLDNFRTKKVSNEQNPLKLQLNIGLQVDNHHPTEACTPSNLHSPRLKGRLSRHSSTGSRSSVHSRKSPVAPPWHQSTRMANVSPVLQKRKLTITKSNPSPAPPRHTQEQNGRLPLLEPELAAPVDITLVGKYQHQLQLIRKLYNHAAKTVSTKRFLETFNELDQRLISAVNIEVKQLKESVHNMMDKHEAALQALSMTPSSSFSSMDMIGAGPYRKNSPSTSEDMKTRTVVDAAFQRQLSMLMKPKLLWKTEKHKSDPGDLWNRCGIAFLPNGNTVVAEYDMNNNKNNRLHIYDNEGTTVSMICEEQLCPLGVAVTAEGHIAVTDCKSKRVKVVTETGEPVCDWGKGHFGWPHGIAINSKGQVIVSDAFNDFVSIHHSDGKMIRQFGCSGSGTNCFRNPFHIAVDHNDNIIVSDCGNNCIKVFNTHGKFLFSNRGVSATSLEGFDANNKNRRLNGPRGVAVDLKGNILVADDSSRVVMFDSRGKYIRNVLTEEEHVKLSGEEHVKFVEGIAMNRDGVLALTECNPSQMFAIKVYRLYEFPQAC